MYSLPMSFWFHRIMRSMSGVSTPTIRAMSTKVHSPNGRSVCSGRNAGRGWESERCAPPAVSETRRRRASKNLCLSVGTTPPSTFVYGILCCENALFVSTEVTQSYL